jgi:hypothetical protein
MRASDTVKNTNSSHDRSYRNSTIERDHDIAKMSDESAYDGANMEKIHSGRPCSTVFRATMTEDSSYKTLNRWQAPLIYITNQVGIGILSLPTAMQTLGLVPCIITIIRMGMSLSVCLLGKRLTRNCALGILVTYIAYVLLQFFRRYPTVLNCVDCFRIIGGKPLAILVGTAFVLFQCDVRIL